MLSLPPGLRVVLATTPVDLRRGHDGLAAVVRTQWRENLYAGHVFVFVGRRRDRVKLLWFERGGFVILYKRLERGRFRLPAMTPDADRVVLEPAQLAALLDGFDWRPLRVPRRWQPPDAPAVPVP